ncbi:hypothetical protein OG455_16650 [Kitasatospora sp. NBC_01287]|uniref:hypothetical protein n=1 Tax=Kitasatospora sp. NBC_01287 TaxID=2903573 RepID=UPI00225BA527|nr:hypothetical protein [Kitasatospora sp. NBC_01287]MCX4747128.1 hypothetical protein [Kitasatospora sp. NBC_01287]
MKPSRLFRTVLLLALAACHPSHRSTGSTAAMMSPPEARTRMTALLDDTFSAVSPALRFRDGWPHSIENDEPPHSANAYLDRYVMTRIAPAKYGALLGLVERHWKERGYTIENVNADTRMPAITARSPEGAVLSLVVGYPGNVTLTAAVTPITATPDPFGPEPPQPTLANGNPDILPTEDDPFWSS